MVKALRTLAAGSLLALLQSQPGGAAATGASCVAAVRQAAKSAASLPAACYRLGKLRIEMPDSELAAAIGPSLVLRQENGAVTVFVWAQTPQKARQIHDGSVDPSTVSLQYATVRNGRVASLRLDHDIGGGVLSYGGTPVGAPLTALKRQIGAPSRVNISKDVYFYDPLPLRIAVDPDKRSVAGYEIARTQADFEGEANAAILVRRDKTGRKRVSVKLDQTSNPE